MKKILTLLAASTALASSAFAIGPVLEIDAAGGAGFGYDALRTTGPLGEGGASFDHITIDNGFDPNAVYDWSYTGDFFESFSIDGFGSVSGGVLAGSFRGKFSEIDFAGLGLSYLGFTLPELIDLPSLIPPFGPVSSLGDLGLDPAITPILPLLSYAIAPTVAPEGFVASVVYDSALPLPGIVSAEYESFFGVVLTAEEVPTSQVPDSGSTALMALAGLAALIGIRRRIR